MHKSLSELRNSSDSVLVIWQACIDRIASQCVFFEHSQLISLVVMAK